MRYGVIGTGYWGEKHVRVAAELASEGVVDEVVVCDSDRERAAELGARFDLDYVTDYRDLDVDAASLATPSPTHGEIGTALLSGGTDLLVEKPLALTAEAAWNLVDAADAADCTLGVGHIFRYHPALTELKRWIDQGRLGEIKYLHSTRFSFRVPRDTTGVLYSLAVHDVDVYDYLLEQTPQRIYCSRDSHLREGIDETATLELDYDGPRGVINSSWQVPVFGKRRDLTVVGTDAAAYLDYPTDTEIELFETSITESADGTLECHDGGSTLYELPAREPLKAELRSFIEAAREGRDPVANGSVGAREIEILERAEVAAEHDEVVPVRGTRSVRTRTS